MLVIAACVLLVGAGIVMVIRWGSLASAHRRPLLLVVPLAGAAAGAIAAGAGGRVVMRLLALTTRDAAGALTEAQATIGEITLTGTIGLVLFAGIPAGLLTAAAYALARPFLPPGRLGGALLGLLVLLLAGATIEPLR